MLLQVIPNYLKSSLRIFFQSLSEYQRILMNPIESCRIPKIPWEAQRSHETPKESYEESQIISKNIRVLETKVSWSPPTPRILSGKNQFLELPLEVKIHRMAWKNWKGNHCFDLQHWQCHLLLQTLLVRAEQAYCAPVLHKSYIVTVATSTSGNLGLEKATTKHMKAIKVQDKYPNIFTIIHK